jgi:hypothetical protein
VFFATLAAMFIHFSLWSLYDTKAEASQPLVNRVATSWRLLRLLSTVDASAAHRPVTQAAFQLFFQLQRMKNVHFSRILMTRLELLMAAVVEESPHSQSRPQIELLYFHLLLPSPFYFFASRAFLATIVIASLTNPLFRFSLLQLEATASSK